MRRSSWASIHSRSLLIGFLVAGSISCAGFQTSSRSDTAPGCVPNFPYQEGWLGGDAAYSILLEDGRTVWLFGDTFVGAPGQRTRKGSAFIHNSIAVSRCGPDGRWSIDYEWGKAADGSPQAFAHDDAAAGYWWLFDGFEYAGDLYVGLLDVESSEPRGAFGLTFRPTGMRLAHIPNHERPPDRWTYEVLPLSNNRAAFPGSAMVVHEEHVYMFAFVDREADNHPRILTRLPLVALTQPDPSRSVEYLAPGGVWKSGLDPDRAQVVMDDDTSEMSVRFHEELEAWVAVYNEPSFVASSPNGVPTGEILFRVAKQLQGPWSEPVAIYEIPELESNVETDSGPDTVCYAAKEHPQFARKGRLLLTYVCNLFTRPGADAWKTLEHLTSDMDVYRPQVVSVPLPTALGDPALESEPGREAPVPAR